MQGTDRGTLQERWEAGRPEREARRANRSAVGRAGDKVVGVTVLGLVGLVGLALVALIVWLVVDQWRTLGLGLFAIGVVVMAGLVWQQIRGR